mgnify:CR=1 FL=1
MGGIETERDLSLDSTFFVAFDLTHRALKSGLAQASSLSVTQYRVLVKLLSAGPDGIDQSSLGKMLDLKPNVVTQAVNALAAAGYATRRRAGDGDRRVRTVGITDAGASHVAQANEPLDEEGHFIRKNVSGRYREETQEYERQMFDSWMYPRRWYSLWLQP